MFLVSIFYSTFQFVQYDQVDFIQRIASTYDSMIIQMVFFSQFDILNATGRLSLKNKLDMRLKDVCLNNKQTSSDMSISLSKNQHPMKNAYPFQSLGKLQKDGSLSKYKIKSQQQIDVSINGLKQQLQRIIKQIMKSLKQDQVPHISNITKPKKQIPSEHLSKYLNYFSLQSPPLLPNLKHNKTIRYTADQFDFDMKIRLKEHDNNYEIVVLTLKYGYFELQVSILNTQQNSNIHLFAQQSIETTQSILHFIIHNDQKFVVKCNSIKAPYQKSVLASTLKEYFLLKLASSLGVGARISNYFGFDLFVYQNCILFFMEECQSARSRLELLNDLRSQQLKQKLLLMHSLKLVHSDIKPENILYCNKKKEFVFIDFGFSRFIEQRIGFKTLSTFAGTFVFCSNEMRTLMLNQNSQVDLYYNDAHCLAQSIRELRGYKKDLCLQETKKYNLDDLQPGQRPKSQTLLYQSNADKLAIVKKLLSLKYKYELFVDNVNLLSSYTAKRFIVSNVQAILSFIQHHFNKTGELVYYFLINSLQFTPSLIYSLLNFQRMRFKKFKELIVVPTLHDSKNIFFDNFEIDQSLTSCELLKSNPKTTLLLSQNKYEQIQDAKTHKQLKLPKHKYYSLLSQYIDLRAPHSNLQQKTNACQIFICKEKIKSREFTTKTEYHELQVSLRHMLKHFIETADEGYEKTIPLLISNLLMLNSLQHQELLQYVGQSLSISFDKYKSSELLFGLCFLVYWIGFNIPRSQNYHQQCQTAPALTDLIKNAYNQKQDQFILAVKQLILPCQYVLKQKPQTVLSVLQKNKDCDVQLIKKLKILYVLNCRKLCCNSITQQAMFVIYEASHIDKTLLQSPQFNLLHIRIFKLAYNSTIIPIINSFCIFLDKCFTGTNILKKLELYHPYLFYSRKDKLSEAIRILCKQCLESQTLKYQRQTLSILADIQYIFYQKQVQYHLLDEMKKIFDLHYIQSLPIPQQIQNFQSFFYISSLIVKIYLILYGTQKQYIEYVTIITDNLAKVLQNVQPSHTKFYCQQKLVNIRMQIVFAMEEYYAFLQFYKQYTEIYKMHIHMSCCCLHHQTIYKIKVQTSKAAQVMLQKQTKGLFPTENEFHQYQLMIYELIYEFKIHLEELKPSTNQSIIYYQSKYLLYTCHRIEQYLQFQDHMLEYINYYPNPDNLSAYQGLTQIFIGSTYCCWKKKSYQLLSMLRNSRLSSNMLVGMFVALIYHASLEHQEYNDLMTYLMLKNVDFIVVQAKLIILKYFFNIYLFRPTSFRNQRQKRYKFVKFVCYTQLMYKLTYKSFSNLMNLNKICKISYPCLAKQRIVRYGAKFYRNIVQ